MFPTNSRPSPRSRRVLSWRLSNTLENDFCVEALEESIALYGTPEIFNSDQGSQFTSENFTSKLIAKNVKISMDGRGRAYDNIFIERLWRSVKYEDITGLDYPDHLNNNVHAAGSLNLE